MVLRRSKRFLSFGFVIGGVNCSSRSDALRRAPMNRSPSPGFVWSDCGAKATISRARSITTWQNGLSYHARRRGNTITHEGND